MRTTIMMTLCAASIGCGPLAVQHGARTLPKGKVAAGVSTLVIHEVGQGAEKDTSVTQAGQSAAFVRWGITNEIDAGIQVYPGGTRIDGKIMLTKPDEALAVSLSPGLHLGYYTDSDEEPDYSYEETDTLTGIDFTVAIGRKLASGGEAWVAPRFGSFTVKQKVKETDEGESFSQQNSIDHRGWGIGLGARLPLNETIWVVPELGIYQRETSNGATNRGLSWVPAVGFATGF